MRRQPVDRRRRADIAVQSIGQNEGRYHLPPDQGNSRFRNGDEPCYAWATRYWVGTSDGLIQIQSAQGDEQHLYGVKDGLADSFIFSLAARLGSDYLGWNSRRL